jgi:nitric oxide reductase subunit B
LETRLIIDITFGLHGHDRRRRIDVSQPRADSGTRPRAGRRRPFTSADIQNGQDLFRKRGLMDYGAVLGHGAYLGPDYTAEALHWMTESMRPADYAARSVGQQAAADAEIAQELRVNRYAAGTLRFTAGQVAGWNSIVERYRKLFVEGQIERALPKGALLPPSEGGGDPVLEAAAAKQLAAFVTWTAWLSVAKRPEASHSYTNNGRTTRRPATPPPPAR